MDGVEKLLNNNLIVININPLNFFQLNLSSNTSCTKNLKPTFHQQFFRSSFTIKLFTILLHRFFFYHLTASHHPPPGIGFGMMYLPSIVVVGFYFDKKRALATGIAVCGSGIGEWCGVGVDVVWG